MGLKEALENLKFDARMVDINLKSRVLTDDSLKKHLEQLEDLAPASIPVDLDNEADDGLNDH